ncbi:MAG: murein transglycosylase A [Desulfobacteraceae bacterium]
METLNLMTMHPLKRLSPLIVLVLVGFWFVACMPKPLPPPPPTPKAALEKLAPGDFPRFADDNNYHQLARGIAMSLAYLKKLPPDRPVAFGADSYSVAHLIRSLMVFDDIIRRRPTPDGLNQAIRRYFRVYRSTGRPEQKDVLFTGYFEPLLHGSRVPSPGFPVPVHTRPSDLVDINLGAFAADLKGRTITGKYTGRSVVPYPTRGGIRRQSGFDRIAPPVVWLRDETDLFILQVRGSGRIELEDGRQFNVLYDGSNGRPYRSVGRLLIDQGRIPADKMSMQAIRNYLRRHPREAQAILDQNPRYIFFKKALRGPLGALGQMLTPLRSLAVDRSMLPSAALAFIVVPMPQVNRSGTIEKWAPYHGFALAQDAGSAIKGPGRIDLFMGAGPRAAVAAGHLKHPGALYFLVLNPDAAS